MNDVAHPGVIVGDYNLDSFEHGFVYSGGVYTTIDVPGAYSTFIRDVNDKGQMAGFYFSGNSNLAHGYFFSDGVFTTLNVPFSDYTEAMGMNNAGQVVGLYGDSTGQHGFLYDVKTYSFTTIDFPVNGGVIAVNDVNDKGSLVGEFRDGRIGFFAVVLVPEPSSIVLAGIAALAIFPCRRLGRKMARRPPGVER